MSRNWWRRLLWWLSGRHGDRVWNALFGRATRRWHRRAHRRAMGDPRYAEIDRRIGLPDGSVLLDDEDDVALWAEQTEIFDRLNPRPWYLRAKAWWDARVGPVPARQRRLAQRARRGWADEDVADLDAYLAAVIAGSVRHLRRRFHSHPPDLSPQQWADVLDEIAHGSRPTCTLWTTTWNRTTRAPPARPSTVR